MDFKLRWFFLREHMNVDMHHRVLAMEDPLLVLNSDPVQLYSHAW